MLSVFLSHFYVAIHTMEERYDYIVNRYRSSGIRRLIARKEPIQAVSQTMLSFTFVDEVGHR